MLTINRNSTDTNPIDNEFIDRILNILTLYNSLPYTIPRKMVEEVIKSSARYFYCNYDGAWRQSYQLVTKQSVEENLQTLYGSYTNLNNVTHGEYALSIRLSPRIRIVKEIFRAEASSKNIFEDALKTEYTTENSSNRGSYGGFGINNSTIDRHLFLLQNITKMVEINNLMAISNRPFPFSYNTESNMLLLKDRIDTPLILHCYIDNDINQLYNNTLFERHVIGCAKRELKRLIGSHTIELPGNVTLNPDEICNNLEDIERVEEIVKNSSGIGDILFKNQS